MDRKRVLFFVPFGSYRVHNQLDAVAATALRIRGHDVTMLSCDGIYRSCDVLAWAGDDAPRQCAECAHAGRAFMGAFGLELTQLRSFLSDADVADATNWVENLSPDLYPTACFESLPLGSWVTSSVYSYFRITADRLSDPAVREVHKQFLFNSVLTARAVMRCADELNPAGACVFNGRFAPYRIALEILTARGIPVVVHERGHIDDSFMLYRNRCILATEPIHACATDWASVPLARDEAVLVRDYYRQREAGKGMNYLPFVNYTNDESRIRADLGIPPGVRVLGYFTTSEYEIADWADYRSDITQLDLIDRLFKVFESRSDCLVIRHHPYIAGDKVLHPDTGFLARAYEQARRAPPNVRVVMPSEKVSSYALFSVLDGAIAPLSTVGVETTARGIATASFPQSPYREGVYRQLDRFDTTSLAALVDDLFARTEEFPLSDLRKLYRFQHSLLAKLCVRFRTLGIRNVFEPDLRISGPSDLEPGHDPALDRLCDALLCGGNPIETPRAEHLARSPEAEEDILSAELADIRARRASRRARPLEKMLHEHREPVAVLAIGRKDLTSAQSASLRRTRYSAVNVYRAGLGLGDLGEVLDRVSEPYVFVLSGNQYLEEHTLHTAVQKLSADPLLAAVWFGGWIADDRGRLSTSIFTERTPADSREKAIAAISGSVPDLALLSFLVFRTGALKNLLSRLKAGEAAHGQIVGELFDGLGTLRVERTSQPAMVFEPGGLLLS